MNALPKTTCIAPWFGSNRMLGEHVGTTLAGCEWVGIPFMGGGAELLHIKARTIVANDLHYHVINLAMTVAHPEYGPQLYRRLRRKLFHADELKAAQLALSDGHHAPLDETPGIDAAEAYFVSQWMGRSGKAGTDGELKGGLPVRWEAGGGDSAVRYRSAVKSILAWRKILERCTFTCLDAFAFLDKCKDAAGHAIYVDAPWPDDGDGYAHKFDHAKQVKLAEKLASFEHARVVVRFGDHPQIRELYRPELGWAWQEIEGRTQANATKREVLIVRNGVYSDE